MKRIMAAAAAIALSLAGLAASLPATAATTSTADTHAAPTADQPARNGLIAFDRHDPASPDNTFVFTIRPRATGARQVLPTHTCCPGWSPDGRHLAVPRGLPDGRIGTATVRPDGTGYRPLPLPDATLNMGCGTGSWSPDQRNLTCESWDDTTTGRNGLYTISSTTGAVLRRLTTAPGADHDIPGSYSPDGQQIAFERFDADGTSVGLFVIHTDGTHLRQLTAAGDQLNIGVDWSPRGNELSYSRHISSQVRGTLWLIHADGTHPRQLVVDGIACGGPFYDPNGIGCHGPRWSPDGTKIVFTGGQNIFTATATGHHLTQVTTDGGDDPDWGPAPHR